MPLRHFLSPPARPRSVSSPAPLQTLRVGAGRRAGWACHVVPAVPPPPSPQARGPALPGAIVIWAAVSPPPAAGGGGNSMPALLSGRYGGNWCLLLPVHVGRRIPSVNINSQAPLPYPATPQLWHPDCGSCLTGERDPHYIPGVGLVGEGSKWYFTLGRRLRPSLTSKLSFLKRNRLISERK